MNRPQIDVTKIYLLNKCLKFVSCWGLDWLQVLQGQEYHLQ